MKELRAEIKMMNFPCFLANFAPKKEKDKSLFSLRFKFRILIYVLRGRPQPRNQIKESKYSKMWRNFLREFKGFRQNTQ